MSSVIIKRPCSKPQQVGGKEVGYQTAKETRGGAPIVSGSKGKCGKHNNHQIRFPLENGEVGDNCGLKQNGQ